MSIIIRTWSKAELERVLTGGRYEGLIKETMYWLEEKGSVNRGNTPSGMSYEQFKRMTAIAVITDQAKMIWECDSSNYYDSYSKLLDRVIEKGTFKSKTYRDNQEKEKEAEENAKKWKIEKERARRLKEYCEKHGLDFAVENKKEVAKMKSKGRIMGILFLLGFATFIVGAAVAMFTDTSYPSRWVWGGIIGGVILIGIGSAFDPGLPSDFDEKIKNGSYKLDE